MILQHPYGLISIDRAARVYVTEFGRLDFDLIRERTRRLAMLADDVRLLPPAYVGTPKAWRAYVRANRVFNVQNAAKCDFLD